MFRRMTKREQKIFVFCVIVVIAFGGFQGIYKPLKAKNLELGSKILVLNKRLKKNSITVQKAKLMNKSYDEFFDKFKQTKTNEQVMSSMIAEIEQVAAEMELIIADIKPKKVKQEEFYNRFSVSLTVNSGFSEIVHFIHQLQDEPHMFTVDQMRFDKASRRRSSTIKSRFILSKILAP